ncbi:ATP-binding protein [Amphritea sp. HPY]|uniref:ATP-binding protein n=1 Tax=Amphritea sp. HPY TaxID=3421652 RepID=UPI003D7E0686
MSLTKLRQQGIRQQVLLLTLLPLVFMTLVLSGYFVSTRISDTEATLIERGETMSRLMAKASEFGLISGLTHQLNALSEGPILEQDVADVIFLDNKQKLLFRSNSFEFRLQPGNTPLHRHEGDFWLFATPVLTSGILVQDSPEYPAADKDRQLLGWVIVALSTETIQARQNQIITNSLVLLFAVLFVTFLVAVRFAEALTGPIIRLTNTVQKLQQGDLGARTITDSSAELGSLQRGINELAERVQTSNQVLESQVDKATQRLRKTMQHLETQNIALQRARQKADQANLAKDEFLARMSHELRTPLTSVLGFTGMLRQTELTFEQQEHCRIINQTSNMLLSIIDDILDFAKLQSDAITLERIQFNPENVIHEAIEMQSQSAATKGLELAFLADASLPHEILGDPTRIRQIATNLISNAIKFTEQGQVIIRLDLAATDADSIVIQLSVKDSGIGVTDEQQKHLFNAFSQADSSITRRFGGSGLGLVIVQKLVKLMQGQVQFSSTPGAGTEVICSFSCKSTPQNAQLISISSFNQNTDLIIFDRHPASLESLVNLVTPFTSKLHPCATLQSLEENLTSIDSNQSSLIFGLSANHDIAHQQKLKIPALFSAFKGNILLLAPAVNAEINQLIDIRNHQKVAVTSKPLRRSLLNKWLSHARLDVQENRKQLQRKIFSPETHIVIAEDNDFNRLLLRKIIEATGATVSEARTGKEALQLVNQQAPDAVLMDVHMPVMDGIEATARIREIHSQLPIIALTANVISSEEHALRQAGVSRIEYKPINDKKLINLLKLLCKTTPESGNKPDFENEHAPTNLSQYQLSKQDLQLELTQQLKALQQGFTEHNMILMQDHTHQLTGLAGLLELPELELCSCELNDAVKQKDSKAIWQLLWRLERLIKHQQYLDE